MQFVKVQSPLIKKAEQQMKLTKELKPARETVVEGNDWQLNLDSWKSRRRKVSEKVIQRAEEMRQIEAVEQQRQELAVQQQKKIKKFSEIVENRSTRSYKLDLYMGQGDDSGLDGTPEPDDILEGPNTILRSDTSEGMTSENESVDGDLLKLDKIHTKILPKVPQKPWRKKDSENIELDELSTGKEYLYSSHLSGFDNLSSTEPSDLDGLSADTETISSEEDITYSSDPDKDKHSSEDGINNQSEDYNPNVDIGSNEYNAAKLIGDTNDSLAENQIKMPEGMETQFKILIKPGDHKGFGFTLKGGKDQGCIPYVESLTKCGAADIKGLKVSDKIISLNGEETQNYSQASLIFSIKQASYTGILDITIVRANSQDHTTEIELKPVNRKSSFAEKLAMFSSNNYRTPSKSSDGNMRELHRETETKRESLVLRRRSAFENGQKDDSLQQRSTSLTHGISSAAIDVVNKRQSTDLTSHFSNIDNLLPKKGPPPPVPSKPKLKSRFSCEEICQDVVESDKMKTVSLLGGKKPKLLKANSIDVADSILNHRNMTNSFKHFNVTKSLEEVEISDTFSADESLADEMVSKTNDVLEKQLDIDYSYEDCTYENNCENSQSENVINVKNGTNSLDCDYDNIGKFLPNSLSDNDYSVETDYNSVTLLMKTVNETSLNGLKECSGDFYDDESNDQCDITNAQIVDEFIHAIEADLSVPETYEHAEDFKSEATIVFSNSKQMAEDSINYFNGDYDDESGHISKNDNLDQDNLLISAFENSCDLKDEDSLKDHFENYALNDYVKEDECFNSDIVCNEGENIEIMEDNGEINDAIIATTADDENNSMQLNYSPLCLPLDKTDEDDVVSASTTTSSETPDTETVIETLPTNLSPLPNDESNGEESTKAVFSDEPPTIISIVSKSSPSSVDITDADNTSHIIESDHLQRNTTDLCDESMDYSYESTSSVAIASSNCEEQSQLDEEYARELEESLDQITSLDIIDEIEQRLMQELEQQGSAYETPNENFGLEISQDNDQQWLYLTEDSELLDDLTPRNCQPPSEPPPPPPVDDVGVMVRANSTKRIKKELWRRRSDFLGLNSSERIEIENILPKPPGLEEILKKEREQNQWLDKRRSLAETEISDPLYVNESVYKNYTLADLGPTSVIEDKEDCSKLSVDDLTNHWKEYVDQEYYDPSIESSCFPSTDPPSPPEEKVTESPQHKAKQTIYNLGAAPKAKIMDSWITEKVSTLPQKPLESVVRETNYNQNYWLEQDCKRRQTVQSMQSLDRRLSMPVNTNTHPQVTIRSWSDRESSYEKERPHSASWKLPEKAGIFTESHGFTQMCHQGPVDLHSDSNCDMDVLESEAHKCSYCGKGLCEGSAMGIEALHLYFHIECFRCCICHILLGNGLHGTDVQVKNNQLYCPNCFTAD